MREEKRKNPGPLEIVRNLLAVAQSDTLLGDLYRMRAHRYLQNEISWNDYNTLKQEQVTWTNLPNRIRNAMDQGDWRTVRELSGEYKTLKSDLESKQMLREMAAAVYESRPVPVDPFSPGMYAIAGVSQDRLTELRATTLRRLRDLAEDDSEWKTLYEKRLEALSTLPEQKSGAGAAAPRPEMGQLEEEAALALEAGNFDRLEQLAGDLVKNSDGCADPATEDATEISAPGADGDHFFAFSAETTARARALGLGLFRVPSRHKEFAPLCRLAWHPAYAQTRGNHSGVVHIAELPLPDGIPETIKSRLQLFAMHPFINSAGVRFLPTMVGEDALVEDFDDPEKGSVMPVSPLLALLDLPHREQLSRTQIENALQEKGHELLKNELGLDPGVFRLVCVPPDLHLRIGLDRGWGQQQIWTHFDGYMIMEDGKRQALAGGDVRFGGIYDLLGVPLNYSSERLIVRFAVVQRKRMATWT